MLDIKMKKYQIRNGKELTESQYRVYLEGVAYGLWTALFMAGVHDGYSKMYDPLYFEGDEVHSYVFDLWDGGRHHNLKEIDSLEKVLTYLEQETMAQLKEE
jgi:hypothetical protein